MIWSLAGSAALLTALGVPIFAALLAGVVLTLVLVTPLPLLTLQQILFGGLDVYALLAIPFFVFAGELMARSGIADRLIAFVEALFGRVPGALGVAAIGGSTLIGTICGSSAAAVAAVGRTMHGRLVEAGYGVRRSVGLITAGGAIDIVIPPSIAMILYGVAAEQSIPRLFIAGIMPGLLIALLMAGYVTVMARWRGIPTNGGFDPARLWRATRAALLALAMPVFVLTGIYGGFFSPTEAGGFAAAYAILVGAFAYRTLGMTELLDAAGRAAVLTAKIMIVVAAASAISWLLTVQGVPQAMTEAVTGAGLSPLGFLVLVNLLLLAVGCVLDPTSSILVLAPLLAPIAAGLGIDPIHFGVVMTVNLAIGMFTPPFGLNIFVAQAVTAVPAAEIWRGIVPFLAVQLVALAVITTVPELSLLLTRTMN